MRIGAILDGERHALSDGTALVIPAGAEQPGQLARVGGVDGGRGPAEGAHLVGRLPAPLEQEGARALVGRLAGVVLELRLVKLQFRRLVPRLAQPAEQLVRFTIDRLQSKGSPAPKT